MKSNYEVTDLLNDLVQINNDRIAGYEKAIKNTKAEDAAYHAMFTRMIKESNDNKKELIDVINSAGGVADADATTGTGKIYRIWMDIKSTFTGGSEESVLELCEFGEDAAQRAYEEALNEEMPTDIRQIIAGQRAKLKTSHDIIRQQRDLHAAER